MPGSYGSGQTRTRDAVARAATAKTTAITGCPTPARAAVAQAKITSSTAKRDGSPRRRGDFGATATAQTAITIAASTTPSSGQPHQATATIAASSHANRRPRLSLSRAEQEAREQLVAQTVGEL